MPDIIPLNDFQRQWAETSQAALAAMARVGASGRFILGSELEAFESALALRWGLRHAVGCGNGSDALEIGLRVLGIQPGDKVLTTPLSAFATTLALMRVGAVPVFVDVDRSGLLNLDLADAALRSGHGDARAIVPVHLFGHSLDLDDLEALSARYDLSTLEDCAQSIDATFASRRTGSVGQVAATSFYPTKNLGCMGDGGALLTSDDEHATRARTIRDYGQASKYIHVEFGLNSRLDELQAAILRDAVLPKLSEWTARRRHIADWYSKGLDHPQLEIPPRPAGSHSVWHLFPVLVRGDRASFVSHLRELGVATSIHYPILISDQPALERYGRYHVFGSLVHARRFAEGEVSLPIHPFLTADEIQRVVDACNSW